MNICNGVKEVRLILGHLYQRPNSGIYLCAYEKRLVNLETGNGWSEDCGFGSFDDFVDVTDQYCLKKV